MDALKRCRAFLLLLGCAGLVFPTHVRAQLPRTAAPQRLPAPTQVRALRDVVLGAEQSLHGTVINSEAHRVARQVVVLSDKNGELASTVTNEEGRFVFVRLRGGVYSLSVDGVSHVFRVWTAAAAPPRSLTEVALTTGEAVQRGQRPFFELFVSDPIVLGVVLAAAIAIPVAINNSRSKKPAS